MTIFSSSLHIFNVKTGLFIIQYDIHIFCVECISLWTCILGMWHTTRLRPDYFFEKSLYNTIQQMVEHQYRCNSKKYRGRKWGHLVCDLIWSHAATGGIVILPMMQQLSLLEMYIPWFPCFALAAMLAEKLKPRAKSLSFQYVQRTVAYYIIAINANSL